MSKVYKELIFKKNNAIAKIKSNSDGFALVGSDKKEELVGYVKEDIPDLVVVLDAVHKELIKGGI